MLNNTCDISCVALNRNSGFLKFQRCPTVPGGKKMLLETMFTYRNILLFLFLFLNMQYAKFKIYYVLVGCMNQTVVFLCVSYN